MSEVEPSSQQRHKDRLRGLAKRQPTKVDFVILLLRIYSPNIYLPFDNKSVE